MHEERINRSKIIQSVQRALDIIDCFDRQNSELSLNELSNRLELNKSTVHGLLNTLVVNDYISQNGHNGKYYLGRRLISKGLLASDSLQQDLKEIGVKHLRILSEKYKVTSHLFLYRNGSLIFLDMAVPTSAYYVVSSVIGRNMPLHATASGKIVLSYMEPSEFEFWVQNNELQSFTEKTTSNSSKLKQQLKTILNNTYSIEDEEVEMGLYSIALPICNPRGQLFATLSITGSAPKVRTDFDNIIADLKAVKGMIEKELFAEFE